MHQRHNSVLRDNSAGSTGRHVISPNHHGRWNRSRDQSRYRLPGIPQDVLKNQSPKGLGALPSARAIIMTWAGDMGRRTTSQSHDIPTPFRTAGSRLVEVQFVPETAEREGCAWARPQPYASDYCIVEANNAPLGVQIGQIRRRIWLQASHRSSRLLKSGLQRVFDIL